jgi:hypothetical protein
MKIELGKTYRDSVTGFVGIAVCRSEWLWGCERAALQPSGLLDGKPIEPQHFDAPGLELVELAEEIQQKPEPQPTGGPSRQDDRRKQC